MPAIFFTLFNISKLIQNRCLPILLDVNFGGIKLSLVASVYMSAQILAKPIKQILATHNNFPIDNVVYMLQI